MRSGSYSGAHPAFGCGTQAPDTGLHCKEQAAPIDSVQELRLPCREHSRTALLCGTGRPLAPFPNPMGKLPGLPTGTHGSAVLSSRHSGSERADHAVLR